MTIKEEPLVKEEGVEEPVTYMAETSEIQSCNPEVDLSPSQQEPEKMEVEREEETTNSVEQELKAKLLKCNSDAWPVTRRLSEYFLPFMDHFPVEKDKIKLQSSFSLLFSSLICRCK